MYIPTSHFLDDRGFTFVVSSVFCAITCTITEVACGIVNVSKKEVQVCIWWNFIQHR